MSRILLILLLTCCFFSCKEEKPQLNMSKEKLILVLADVHTAEAAMQNLRTVIKDSISHVYYNQIFQIHQTDRSTFDHDMDQLRQFPYLAEEIYSTVVDTLNARKKSK